MKFLLDTRVLLWVVGDAGRLKPETQRTLADDGNTIFVSVVSLWEIAVKFRIGKLEADVALIAAQLAPASKIQLLGITPQHLITLNNLPIREQHRDPFEHLIIAQAISEDMTLVTQDRHAPLYPVQIMMP